MSSEIARIVLIFWFFVFFSSATPYHFKPLVSASITAISWFYQPRAVKSPPENDSFLKYLFRKHCFFYRNNLVVPCCVLLPVSKYAKRWYFLEGWGGGHRIFSPLFFLFDCALMYHTFCLFNMAIKNWSKFSRICCKAISGEWKSAVACRWRIFASVSSSLVLFCEISPAFVFTWL